MNSIKDYQFYIVIKKDGEYLVSACEFAIVSETTSPHYIFQMLKDTHFSSIEDETSDLYYEVVAIKHSGQNSAKKQLIYNYYNEAKMVVFIKPILKFNCNKISEHISEQTLVINNTHSAEYMSKINERFNCETLEIDAYLKNVELSFTVNDYETKKYISNPSFTLNKNCLNYLL
jgi:hypothetical protein